MNKAQKKVDDNEGYFVIGYRAQRTDFQILFSFFITE